MFAWYIHLESSRTALDNSVFECLKRYIINSNRSYISLCRLYDIFVFVSWLRTILLCGVDRLLKVISDLTSLLNPWVILVIRSVIEILRGILVRSRLIVHPTNSSSSPFDWFTHDFLMHSVLFVNLGLSQIDSVLYRYTMKIKFLSSFTLYRIQG